MSDDLNMKIKQLTDALSQEKLPENLQSLLSMLASSGSKPIEDDNPLVSDAKETRDKHEDKNELRSKLSTLMGSVGKANDPRVNLLDSLRPFLSKSRQSTINNCIKFLQLSSITRLINENDKFK